MDEIIKTLCESLKKEAGTVLTCTEGMRISKDVPGAEDAERTFTLNRLDAVDHIQNLTLVLTKLLTGEFESHEQ